MRASHDLVEIWGSAMSHSLGVDALDSRLGTRVAFTVDGSPTPMINQKCEDS